MTPEEAVTAAIAAAQKAVAEAITAALADVALGEAAAALGDAQAEAGYALTKSILEEDAIDLIPALLALEATAIMEGLAAYVAEQKGAAAAFAAVQAEVVAAFSEAQEMYREAEHRISMTKSFGEIS